MGQIIRPVFVVGLAVRPGAVFPGCCAPGPELRPRGRGPVLPVPMTANRRGPLCPESNTDRFRIPVYYLYNIIGGSRGGREGRTPPPGRPNSFDFMQFSGKFGVFTPPPGGFTPPLGKILDPPLNIPAKHTCVLPVQNTCTYLLNKLSDGSSKKNFGLFLCQIQREILKYIYQSRAKRIHCNRTWGCSAQWRRSMGFWLKMARCFHCLIFLFNINLSISPPS